MKHKSTIVYKRLKNLINNVQRKFYVFVNEHHKYVINIYLYYIIIINILFILIILILIIYIYK